MPAWKGIVGQGFTADDFQNYLTTIQFNVWRPQFVVLHNTAVPTLADWHKVSGQARMNGLQSYYRDNQQWSAGPHLFVADDLIWVFTPLNTTGVHSPSWNAISWGVELVGDYSKEQLAPALKENAIAALAGLHSLAGLDPNSLHLHREDPKTTHKGCPGENIVKTDMIQWITDRIAGDHPGDHAPGAAEVDAGQTV
jgi:N-acetylmuramoyl-L-alanine amidase CwlA